MQSEKCVLATAEDHNDQEFSFLDVLAADEPLSIRSCCVITEEH